MSLSIHFVRHGQTELSRANTFCGALDPPLSEAGQRMAEALGARYAGERLEAIYASPMLRARQTAAPLLRRCGVPLQLDPDLREIAYGEWEGRAEEEVARSDPERFRAWAERPGDLAPPGGETGRAIAERVLAAIARIRARHPDGKVLVFSHKATLRVLGCCLLGLDPGLFRARLAHPVASVTVFEFKPGGPLLLRLGDVSHLPPDLAAADGS